jgi:tetratricopeptide (TPR) repeat protein
MWALLEVPVGKVCRRTGCSKEGDVIGGLHDQTCGACGQALEQVTKRDPKAVAAAIIVGVLVLTLVAWGTHAWRAHRVAVREAERLEQAKIRLESALSGARASQVAVIADTIQADLGLTQEQRALLLEGAAPRIAQLPRDLGAELEPHLERLLREAHTDGVVSAEEQARLESFVVTNQVSREAAEAFITHLGEKLEAANRSVARGRLLVEQRLPEEARGEFQRATEVDPANSMAWANLGAVHQLLGSSQQGLDCYDRAIELDPRNWLAHFNVALDAARQGNRRSAFDHVAAALAALPATAGRERRALMRDLLENPSFEALRRDPRFGEILDGAETSISKAR